MAKKKLKLSTLGVRAGQVRSQFQEHSEALYLTSSFVFDDAAQAAGRFPNAGDRMGYSRYTNPTVAMFQERLAALEGAESCVATASGMAAILAAVMVHLKAGDHVVCSNAVFGATIQLFSNILGRFGVETTFVSPTRVEEWQKAVKKSTRMFFLETPSNPLTEISDVEKLSKVARAAGEERRTERWTSNVIRRVFERIPADAQLVGAQLDVVAGRPVDHARPEPAPQQ